MFATTECRTSSRTTLCMAPNSRCIRQFQSNIHYKGRIRSFKRPGERVIEAPLASGALVSIEIAVLERSAGGLGSTHNYALTSRAWCRIWAQIYVTEQKPQKGSAERELAISGRHQNVKWGRTCGSTRRSMTLDFEQIAVLSSSTAMAGYGSLYISIYSLLAQWEGAADTCSQNACDSCKFKDAWAQQSVKKCVDKAVRRNLLWFGALITYTLITRLHL